MERRWKIERTKRHVTARFDIDKHSSASFSSQNPVDAKKYLDIMMDELKLRNMFTTKATKDRYEEFMENDNVEMDH